MDEQHPRAHTDLDAAAQALPDDPATPTNRRARRWSRRARVIAFAAIVCLLGGAGTATTWALNRFVIDHVEIDDVAAYEAEQRAAAGDAGTTAADGESAATEDSSTAVTMTEDSYTNGDISISVTRYATGSGTDAVTYYVADVTLADASTLRSAFANNQFGQNIIAKTSEIAAANDAVFAINGDYYGFRDTGIVIRNGVVYRDEPARTGLAFYTDGTVELYDETDTNAQALLDAGVWNTLSFGPALVADGAVISGIDDVEIDTNFGNHSVQGSHPRTAVGVIDENHLVFVVVDGRDKGYSRGATMTELAQIMVDLGATTAYNLDGGGSSTMYFGGEVINQPSNGGERGTSDILYIAG